MNRRLCLSERFRSDTRSRASAGADLPVADRLGAILLSRAAIRLAAVLIVIAVAAQSLHAAGLDQDSATPAHSKAEVAAAPAPSPTVIAVQGEYTSQGPDARLRRELLRCYVRTRGLPFVAAIPVEPAPADARPALPEGAADESTSARTEAPDTLDAELLAAFLATPSLLEDRSVRLTLGPWLVRPGQPVPQMWWSTYVDFTSAEVAEASERTGVETSNADAPDLGAAAIEHPNLLGLLGDARTLAVLGKLHKESVAGLLGCSAIASRDALTAASEPATAVSVPPPAARPIVPYLGTSSALELVIWIQSLDAEQCALRAEGVDRLKDADAVVADIRAVLRALEARQLLQLLEERVPLSAPSGASLCASPSWPNDAWDLVAAVEKGRKNSERVRSELLRLAAAVAAQHRLPPEVLARLEERLEVVAGKLPLNLQWNQRLAEEIRDRVGDVMDPSGGAPLERLKLGLAGDVDGSLNIGGAVIDGMKEPDDIVGGRVAANRAAWDVYGYLWSGIGALLPSEQAQRDWQREAVLSEFNSAAALRGTPPEVSKMLANDLASSLSDRWRPWMQFPVSNEILNERILPSFAGSVGWSLDALRSNEFRVTGEWKVLFWWGVADESFAMEPNSAMVRHRNQPFPDCRPYYINGVGLSSRR